VFHHAVPDRRVFDAGARFFGTTEKHFPKDF
jgi:hypothetical protein